MPTLYCLVRPQTADPNTQSFHRGFALITRVLKTRGKRLTHDRVFASDCIFFPPHTVIDDVAHGHWTCDFVYEWYSNAESSWPIRP